MKSPRSTAAIKAQCEELISIPNLVPVTVPPICTTGVLANVMEFETLGVMEFETLGNMEFE